MPCRFPPPLNPAQLSAALDGEAETGVYEHLANCPECAMHFEEARQFERRLTGALHRWDCPSPQTLAEYHLGRMEVEAATAVARHAEACLACGAELAELRAFLAADPRPAPAKAEPAKAGSIAARLGGLVAQLLPQTPGLALRGTVATAGPQTAAIGDVTIVLDVQPTGPDQARLLGQLAAPQAEAWTGALAQLWRGGELERTVVLDDTGGLQFEGVAPGTVDLVFTPQTGQNIVWPNVSIET